MNKKLLILFLAVLLVSFFYIIFSRGTQRINKPNLGVRSELRSIYNKFVFTPEQISYKKIYSQDHSWIGSIPRENLRVIMATGDVMFGRSINTANVNENDFVSMFDNTRDVLKSGDLTLVNLETPIIAKCPLLNTGFQFCADLRSVQGLVSAGVDVANIANNHIGNFSGEGIKSTIKVLTENNILVSGTSQPAYIDKRGIKFAFIGFNDVGKIAAEDILNAEEDKIREKTLNAKKYADIVIVSFHWGEEYRSLPNDNQKSLGRLAIDSGADLVIGNHPHWIQPVEIYKEKAIVYSHGNFIFDQYWSLKTRQGIVGKYTFYDKKLIDIEFLPVLIDNTGSPRFLEENEKEKILKEMEENSSQIN